MKIVNNLLSFRIALCVCVTIPRVRGIIQMIWDSLRYLCLFLAYDSVIIPYGFSKNVHFLSFFGNEDKCHQVVVCLSVSLSGL